MPEQIYDKQALRKKAVEALRTRGAHMSTGMVSMAIGVQYWAVDQALEEAYLAKEVTFSAGIGWLAAPEQAAKPTSGATGMDLAD